MILNDPDQTCGSFYIEGRDRDQATGSLCRPGAVLSEKGKATLEMYWKTPGADKFDIIPAMAYSHDSNAS